MERLCDTDSVLNVIRLDEPVRRPGTTVLGVQKRLYDRRRRRRERELSATA